MKKSEIDLFFVRNQQKIQRIILDKQKKSVTKNETNILSDIYLFCIERKFANLDYVAKVADNMYRWKCSRFNLENASISNEIGIENINIEDDYTARNFEETQNLEYLLEKYLLNANKIERIFFDIYTKKGIRTVREVATYLQISNYSAHQLITNFKSEIMSGKSKLKKGQSTQVEETKVEETQPKPAPKTTKKKAE